MLSTLFGRGMDPAVGSIGNTRPLGRRSFRAAPPAPDMRGPFSDTAPLRSRCHSSTRDRRRPARGECAAHVGRRSKAVAPGLTMTKSISPKTVRCGSLARPSVTPAVTSRWSDRRASESSPKGSLRDGLFLGPVLLRQAARRAPSAGLRRPARPAGPGFGRSANASFGSSHYPERGSG